ncbi:MAG: hypothetical protein SGJ21_14790 [Alphaproteobacteria bacterium]|nr:hypothetical protein [Alphaproteobacteria bacterium]
MSKVRTSARALAASRKTVSPNQADAVTLIAPVWGSRHIERFLDLVLPTWLSPGNAPALSKDPGLIVRIMTRAADIARLDGTDGVNALRKVSEVEFSTIDDLLAPDCVPVTLTLALHRGIARGVVAGRPRSFLFINSDFALADGSLAYAARAIQSGKRLLLSPSLRVDEESIRPALRARLQEPAFRGFPPREMVGLALQHLHPTVHSSRMDQAWLKSRHTHQLYWLQDQDTLLARGFCLFALGLTTSEPPPPAAAFCDYGMGPMITGDIAADIVDHSDKFLALEIAPHDYEAGLCDFGPPDTGEIGRQLQQWTTEFHRRQALTPLVFTAAPPDAPQLPAHLPSTAAISAILGQLGPPQPMSRHPNWQGGLLGWLRSREEIGILSVPVEIDAKSGLPAAPERVAPRAALRTAARRFLVGGARRAPWQPYHTLSRNLAGLVGEASAEQPRPSALGASRLYSFQPLDEFRNRHDPAPGSSLIIGLDLTNWSSARSFLNQARLAGVEGQKQHFLLTHADDSPITALDLSRIHSAADFLETEALLFFDTRLDAAAEKAYGRIADGNWSSRPASLAFDALLAPVWTAACLASGLLSRLRPVSWRPRATNVALLTGRVRWNARTRDGA